MNMAELIKLIKAGASTPTVRRIAIECGITVLQVWRKHYPVSRRTGRRYP